MNNQQQLEKLLRPEEVAGLLRVTVRTVRKWQREGIIPYCKIGKRIRFKESHILELLKKSENV